MQNQQIRFLYTQQMIFTCCGTLSGLIFLFCCLLVRLFISCNQPCADVIGSLPVIFQRRQSAEAAIKRMAGISHHGQCHGHTYVKQSENDIADDSANENRSQWRYGMQKGTAGMQSAVPYGENDYALAFSILSVLFPRELIQNQWTFRCVRTRGRHPSV